MLAQYAPVTLTTDTTVLTPKERQMIPLLIDAARAMDPIFWQEITAASTRCSRPPPIRRCARYVEINYGPWDRLDNDSPFVAGIGDRSRRRANYYPRDMTKDEFE